jgi:hypothetical protein
MSVKIEGLRELVSDLKRTVETTIRQAADEVYIEAKARTPIKSGNARKNWNKSVDKENFVVENRVPYIERLEAGASRQAPKGIIGPTLTAVKGKLR